MCLSFTYLSLSLPPRRRRYYNGVPRSLRLSLLPSPPTCLFSHSSEKTSGNSRQIPIKCDCFFSISIAKKRRLDGTGTKWRWIRRRDGGGERITWLRSGRTKVDRESTGDDWWIKVALSSSGCSNETENNHQSEPSCYLNLRFYCVAHWWFDLVVASSNIALVGGAGSNERINWKRKGVVTCALTILTSSQAILIVWSKRAGKYEYSVTTANFLVETLKCALSLFALTRI